MGRYYLVEVMWIKRFCGDFLVLRRYFIFFFLGDFLGDL
jgi:hypothetical protein